MKLKSLLTVLILFLISGAFLAFDGEDKSDYGFEPIEVNPSGDLEEIIDDTVSNSMNETGYLVFESGKIVDSVQFIVYGSGELDVDRLILTKAFTFEYTPGNYLKKNYSTAAGDTTTLTTNLDSAVTIVTYAVTWTGSKLTGANAVYCQVDAASSGNDAGDPNLLKLYGKVFYRPQ